MRSAATISEASEKLIWRARVVRVPAAAGEVAQDRDTEALDVVDGAQHVAAPLASDRDHGADQCAQEHAARCGRPDRHGDARRLGPRLGDHLAGDRVRGIQSGQLETEVLHLGGDRGDLGGSIALLAQVVQFLAEVVQLVVDPGLTVAHVGVAALGAIVQVVRRELAGDSGRGVRIGRAEADLDDLGVGRDRDDESLGEVHRPVARQVVAHRVDDDVGGDDLGFGFESGEVAAGGVRTVGIADQRLDKHLAGGDVLCRE
ncbi:MAG: hypothetical protein QM714_17065 [Nocardioides sp.]|uniref:hypothetical protein n=1 Tax=Nocardioides sp. TaxID=35761 RepID=UPI0039E72256